MKRNRLGTMTYNVGIKSHSELDVNTLKAITNEIFENASIQTSTSGVKLQTVTGIDLYNGKTDSATARQVAMSNSGLQFNSNNKLDAKLKFLNAKAAAITFGETKTIIDATVQEMKLGNRNSNPFNGGDYKANKKATGYLFINAA